jgi:hypothetical protein
MQSLENITEKTFVSKLKDTFFRKLIPLISAATFAFAGCGDNKNCLNTGDTLCIEKVTYFTDTCGNLNDIKENCYCGCNPNHTECNKPCCGDEKVDITEECDKSNLNGNTCQSLGFDKGILRCDDDCRLNVSNCCDTVSCLELGKECSIWGDGCGGIVDCGNCSIDETCEDGNCIPSLDTKFVNGIPIKSGKTNQDGQIFFTDYQTGEEVIVTVKNSMTKTLLPDVDVGFIDGDGFEDFNLMKADYISHFEVFPHNSNHEFNLFPESHHNFTVFDYYFEQNPDKYNAMENYIEWSENSYTYSKCMTKEELEKDRELSMFILSFFAGGTPVYKVVSTANDVITSLESLGIVNPLPIYQVFTPLNFTAPPIIKGSEYVPENCQDNLDNDCDGKIDMQDEDCTCADECSYIEQKKCFDNGWKECGDYDSDRCLEWSVLNTCNPNEHCENGECTPSCIPSTEICDGLDNDCDGQTDENLIQACYTACGQGLEWCIGGIWQNCNATKPSTEICDGLDNDCDGQTDEGCSCINGQIRQCGINIGECEYGTQNCSNGEWENCIGVINPVNEICDSLDNNCNGEIDEGNLCSGSDCLEGICCYPHDHLVCDWNHNHSPWSSGLGLYWTDACGLMSDELAENCPDGCICSNNENGVYECVCYYPSCFDPDNDGYGINCDLGKDCDNHNSNIHPGATEVLNGLDDNCDGRIDEGFVNTGNPQITLFWNNASDLDLHIYSPNDCHLYYGNKNCGTGHLDRDANRACISTAETPPENIYWDVNQAPSGTYRVEVDYFQDCNSGPTPYTVSVSKEGNVTTYSGTLNNEGDTDTVISFDK